MSQYDYTSIKHQRGQAKTVIKNKGSNYIQAEINQISFKIKNMYVTDIVKPKYIKEC